MVVTRRTTRTSQRGGVFAMDTRRVGVVAMMRALVSTAVRFRLIVLEIAGVLLLIGATQLQSARLDALPEFGPTTVEVQTEALGLSAEEVEELVTVPLEAVPNTAPVPSITNFTAIFPSRVGCERRPFS